MTSIRKRNWTAPDGAEKTGWQVDYVDTSGKRRRKQFARKKEAENWLTTAAYQVQQGTHTPDSQSITIAKASELWLVRARREKLETSTIAAYDQHARLHIIPLCGSTKLSQLTKPIVEGYRDTLVEKLSRPMATRVLRSLTSIIDEAQSRGYVAQNVARGVRVRRAQREKPKVVIPSKAEMKALLQASAASAEPMALPLVNIAIFAGLRASELRGLSWPSLDLVASTITVNQRADLKNVIGPPKSKAGYRTIPLPPATVKALKAWKLACPPNDQNLVFPSPAKKVMTHRYMSLNILAPVQVAAKVCDPRQIVGKEDKQTTILEPRYTLHDLRHAAASLWIEQRVDAKRVQNWMGHGSIQVTFDTYGHLFKQAEQDQAVALAVEREVMGDGTPMAHGD